MPNTRDDPVLRLANLLKQLAEEESYLRIAERIREANASHGGRSVERRKLKRLAEGEDVTLTISELIALDTFLTPLGEGLADKPLFERPAPIRSLVAKAQVTIVLGAYARPRGRRNDLSRWDVRSMAHLLRAIEKRKPETHVDIRDVLCEKEKPEPPWYLKSSGPSVCSIGSPRASYATEIMLAEMFGVDPFDRDSAGRVPFRFIWSPQTPGRHSSSFRIDANQVFDAEESVVQDLRDGTVWGVLQTKDQLYFARGREDEARDKKNVIWKSHGIVVTQQRSDGRVWMVCAGLTGPATYAATVALASELTGPVPEARSGHSPVRWDIVECTVDTDTAMPGDNRIVTSQSVIDQGYWDPAVTLD
jgi:hypothetical protein